jgi:hypothetical protein
MKGLGSQLCDYLVKKVIKHIEDDVNPRMKHMSGICEELVDESYVYDFCQKCNTPYNIKSEKARHCDDLAHKNLCIYTCGEPWCKTFKCSFCDKELCNEEWLNKCELCSNNICFKCNEKYNGCKGCDSATMYCKEHYQDNVFNIGLYNNDECYYIGRMCTECNNSAICSVCEMEYHIRDIAGLIDIKNCQIEEHTQCGIPICKNCILPNKRIKI